MSTPEEIAEEVFENTPEIKQENENIPQKSEEEEGEEEVEGDKEVEGEEGEVEEEVEGEEVEEEVEVEGEEVEEGEEIENFVKKESPLNVASTNVVNAINHVLEKMNSGLVNMNQLFSQKNKKNNIVEGNISNMFHFQQEKESDEKYTEYLNYLKAFYEKESKKTVYQKSYQDGKLVLSNQKGEKIVITPSIIVDLDNYKNMLNKEVHNTLFKIVNLVETYSMTNESHKEEFQKLKNIYITFKKQLNDIENIETSFYTKIRTAEDEIATLAIQLNVMKEERIEVYSKIKTQITQKLKETLILQFKESQFKIPSTDVISKISQESSIPIEDIEFWFSWIEKSYLYVNKQHEYSSLIQSQKKDENDFEHLMKNYILQKPNIQFS
jgi:hypothetical protein